MTSIKINHFKSSLPRLADHLVSNGGAARAIDCKLSDGTLDSWRECLEVGAVPAGAVTSYQHGCCWLYWPKCVDVAEGSIQCQELFTTGDKDWPAVGIRNDELCTYTWSRLGVPCGGKAMERFDSGFEDNKSIHLVTFVYQYVNARGKVGAMSYATEPLMTNDGRAVVLSGWPIPAASWGVTHIRISVAVTAYDTGKDLQNSLDTTYMVVADVPIGAGSYTYNKFHEDLYESPEEDVVEPPPANLRGLCRIASMNCFAGFVNNRVYFSENNNPDNWPHYLDLDYNVRGLVESNGVIYVGTDGHPAVIAGEADCKTAACRTVVQHADAYPMLGMGSRKMVALPNGAGYPTVDGFVVMQGNKPPSLLTWATYAPEDWHQMPPESVLPAYNQGFLFVFGARRSFCMGLNGMGKEGWESDNHTELSDKVNDVTVSRSGIMYLVKGTKLMQWNASATRRPHVWVSPEIVSGTPLHIKGAYINVGVAEENVKIKVDGIEVEDITVFTPKVFTLPTWACGLRHQVTFTGTGKVSLFSMATSLEELTA